jgi:chloramphenicol O-acetyltransferase
MYYLIPHFLTKKYDAMNMVTVDIPVEPLRKYMNEKRKEGYHISHIALFLAAYIKAVQKYPALNRFIVNRRIYQHNDFTVSMVVLRPGEDNDTFSKIYFDLTENIFEVQKKIDEYISENRKDNNANDLDKTMDKLVSMNWLVRVAINILRFEDYHNMLPKSVIKASPFHASLLLSNLASIRTNHIYHHVYEFGTTSIGITMGNLREIPKRTKDGVMLERSLPLGVVMDERICSGHYFATAFNFVKELLSDPRRLEA